MATKGAKPADEGSPPPSPNKGKKLLIIILALFLLLALLGGGLAVLLAGSSHDEGDDDEYVEEVAKPKKVKKKNATPVFLNLEPFTVNLIPETGDQYLQISLSLELDDAASETTLKALMPRIRNNITLLLTSKKAAELQTKEGKENLAQALRDEINQAVEPSHPGKKGPITGPVETVLFTSFIIQ
ncbi:MAG: flagellar basal body-associated FliL family protein [Betaproteobacteria bacterium]|nr:flagellar basal body-associated FliL family protein [Betaproteobacteria bacterium]MCL2885330.1 flagellar basal body-associated FliL family protein [Betaproteobacteria bacterium]